ncbi:MAG: TIGR03862 family flavoprotein [Parvularcula sp.]|jgi:uncharacterized flavoprotein (TIGR03862 family)|nr:TIGR03862 family flavoprotein [Parvularcula sp.]
MRNVAIVGGGPAGLMAAERASQSGAKVTVYDRMPTLARKFLMAGKSGLNITHAEEEARFLARYGDDRLSAIIEAYGGAAEVRRWMEGLGQDVFVGSTGRVFPKAMKASPLLRAWIVRLADGGVGFKPRHRLIEWEESGALRFETPDGPVTIEPERTIWALGGGSWARLGSDGAWASLFARRRVPIAPFEPSNAGLRMNWSPTLTDRFAGAPLKNVLLRAPDGRTSRGEVVVTKRGLEGGGIYPLTPSFDNGGVLTIDLLPQFERDVIEAKLSKQPRKQSLANRLRRAVKVEGLKTALLREALGPGSHSDGAVASALKSLPLPVTGPAPLDEAISTRGGVPWEALTDDLELMSAPGHFCAGEMIAWDAPTGGYLLTACLATGALAGERAVG